MNIDYTKIKRAEDDILKVLANHEVQYNEASLIFIKMLAFICLDSGFPYEKFRQLLNEQARDLEENWPIG